MTTDLLLPPETGLAFRLKVTPRPHCFSFVLEVGEIKAKTPDPTKAVDKAC